MNTKCHIFQLSITTDNIFLNISILVTIFNIYVPVMFHNVYYFFCNINNMNKKNFRIISTDNYHKIHSIYEIKIFKITTKKRLSPTKVRKLGIILWKEMYKPKEYFKFFFHTLLMLLSNLGVKDNWVFKTILWE